MSLEGFRGEGRNRKAHAESFANRFLGEKQGFACVSRKLGDSSQVLRVEGWSAGVSVGLGGRCLGSLQYWFHFVGPGNPFTLLDEAREALRRGDKSRDHILGILLLAEARSRKFRNSWGQGCLCKQRRQNRLWNSAARHLVSHFCVSERDLRPDLFVVALPRVG